MKINTLFKPEERITLKKYLHKCGIKDIDQYIDHSYSYIEDCNHYDNMEQGYKLLFGVEMDSDKTTYIISDSDAEIGRASWRERV